MITGEFVLLITDAVKIVSVSLQKDRSFPRVTSKLQSTLTITASASVHSPLSDVTITE